MPESEGNCGEIAKTFHNRSEEKAKGELTIDTVEGCRNEASRFGIEIRDKDGKEVSKTWYGVVPTGPDLYGPVPPGGTLNLLCPTTPSGTTCRITWTFHWVG